MSDGEEVKFCLKVMINKQKTKVLFAEADSNFTDVLLSFLTLPLGKIVRILEKHYGDKAPIFGSLTTLYNGLANLEWQFWLAYDKFTLLNPESSLQAERDKLKLNVDGTKPITSVDTDFKRKSKRSRNANVLSKPQVADDGGFTVKTESFVITDDLQMAPVVAGSILRTLINLGITETDGAELRNLTLGFNEIMDLLKGSLLSNTPLTDLIFPEGAKTNFVTGNLKQHVKKEESSSSCKKMTVKAMVQKSNNKILFVEANGDFVDFLCSFLITPLGGVECLLGNNTSLWNIDNLYRSITNINGDKYLKTKDTKAMLLKPKLYHGYISINHFLPFIEKGLCTSNSSYVSPSGGKFVKGERMYVVTDDLTVTPFCMASSFSILSRLKIPLSDVNEVELEIGLDEALRILKASLTSTSALTNGLMNNPISKKQPKQEH